MQDLQDLKHLESLENNSIEATEFRLKISKRHSHVQKKQSPRKAKKGLFRLKLCSPDDP